MHNIAVVRGNSNVMNPGLESRRLLPAPRQVSLPHRIATEPLRHKEETPKYILRDIRLMSRGGKRRSVGAEYSSSRNGGQLPNCNTRIESSVSRELSKVPQKSRCLRLPEPYPVTVRSVHCVSPTPRFEPLPAAHATTVQPEVNLWARKPHHNIGCAGGSNQKFRSDYLNALKARQQHLKPDDVRPRGCGERQQPNSGTLSRSRSTGTLGLQQSLGTRSVAKALASAKRLTRRTGK